MVCANEEPDTILKDIPGLPTLLDYLGFEHGALRSGYESEMVNWIKGLYQDSLNGNAALNSITLDALFGRSMEVNRGDIFLSLVTVHNVLRDNRESRPVQDMIEKYRGDGGDERGARYHLFGMALYSFAYEHFMEIAQKNELGRAQLVMGATLKPETVATLEESIVSGDIVSDVTEYAVDLQGAKIGRRLYREARIATISELADEYGVDESLCGEVDTLSGFTAINFDGSYKFDPSEADVMISSNLTSPTISWGSASATSVSVLDTTNASPDGGTASVLYCIKATKSSSTDKEIPFSSPVIYGDYSISNTKRCSGTSSIAPALQRGNSYQVVVNAESGKIAIILFTLE